MPLCQRCLLFFFSLFFFVAAFAKTNVSGFMTSQDLLQNDSPSNIVLHNNRSSAVTVYGLYIPKFTTVAAGSASCESSTLVYDENLAAGPFIMPVTINPGKSAIIGGNYLYNMIYEANYYIQLTHPSSPPGCQLPGCTWGADTNNENWCIFIGALGPVTTPAEYTSANIPPVVEAVSTGTYSYKLISSSSSVLLGPIVCNDQTQTCSVANQQTQTIS